MLILDGKIASAAVKATLLAQTQALTTEGKRAPHLAAILVGNNGASETYVASKVKNCEETGFESTLIRLELYFLGLDCILLYRIHLRLDLLCIVYLLFYL